jgi:hypothetical protein
MEGPAEVETVDSIERVHANQNHAIEVPKEFTLTRRLKKPGMLINQQNHKLQ